MTNESPNKKTKLKPLRRGLSIYKTGRSPFWHARIYDNRTKRYVVRSTKETKRLDAAEVAEEIFETFKSKQNLNLAVKKDRSFEHFAQRLSSLNAIHADDSYTYRDEQKILFRQSDGLVSYFGKHDVSKITTGMVRDYLAYLDSRRSESLAPSTKTKQCIVLRKVLAIAFEDGVIDAIPAMPKQKTKDKPRSSFTESEYKHLITTARRIAKEGKTKVRGVLITREHVEMWQFLVHSFVRPTQTELYAIRHCDVAHETDPIHLEITMHGKTGYRISATMPYAGYIYNIITWRHRNAETNEYIFMPEYSNRATVASISQRLFNYVLEKAELKNDQNGNPRSLYSLRHFALQSRLRSSRGKVNIYWLAKNAGTSVEQLERFYLKNMPLSPEQIRNLQSV